MSIVITTPAGHIGSRTLEKVVEAGAEVSVIVRNPEKLPEGIRSRLKIHQGSMDDRDFLVKALAGAKALFWLTPPGYSRDDVANYYQEMGDAVTAAIKANQISHVVNLSSAGAQLSDAGPVSYLGELERRISAATPNAVHLRPGYFMENFFMDLETIRQHGAVFSLLQADFEQPFVATQDIGEVAARLLLQRDWKGTSVQGVHGPEHLTMAKATAIVADSIGKPINYVVASPEETLQGMTSGGVAPGFAAALVQMWQKLGKPGSIAEKRTAQTTTHTTLREWAHAALRPIFAS